MFDCLRTVGNRRVESEQNRTRFGSIAFDFVRLRSILFDWFDLFDSRTHAKLDVRLPNAIEQQSFDCFLFDFARSDTLGLHGTTLSHATRLQHAYDMLTTRIASCKSNQVVLQAWHKRVACNKVVPCKSALGHIKNS